MKLILSQKWAKLFFWCPKRPYVFQSRPSIANPPPQNPQEKVIVENPQNWLITLASLYIASVVLNEALILAWWNGWQLFFPLIVLAILGFGMTAVRYIDNWKTLARGYHLAVISSVLGFNYQTLPNLYLIHWFSVTIRPLTFHPGMLLSPLIGLIYSIYTIKWVLRNQREGFEGPIVLAFLGVISYFLTLRTMPLDLIFYPLSLLGVIINLGMIYLNYKARHTWLTQQPPPTPQLEVEEKPKKKLIPKATDTIQNEKDTRLRKRVQEKYYTKQLQENSKKK